MITLKKLQWSNCFSYGPDNEISLDDNTVTQIIGTNGMGKSSIPLIIEEALFNKNSKGIKKADIPNRYINNGYDICLNFTKDEDDYTITINRRSNVKVKLEKNGEDISSHTATNTYKSIQEIVGTDFKTFTQLVYQNTNASLAFLTATDTNRKKFLIELLQLERYVELFEVFKSASKDITLEVTEVETYIRTIEKWLLDNNLGDATVLPMLNEDILMEDDEKQLQHLMDEVSNISEKNKKISKNNSLKTMLRSIDLTKAQNISVAGIESYDDIQSKVGSLNQISAGSKKDIAKLEKLGDICPTCEQAIDSSFKDGLLDAARGLGEDAKSQIDHLENQINEIKENNRLFQSKQQIERDWNDLYRSIDQSLPSNLVDEEQLNARIERVQGDLDSARAKLESQRKENERRVRNNTRIELVQERAEQLNKELDAGVSKLAGVKELSSNLEVLKKSFSTNGLVAYKIENLVKELEELVNYYLTELSDGRFTLEFVVNNDRLNVQIGDNSATVDILALSSGELARVNTATLLAIRKLMSSISKSRINVLFLDEVINVLDDVGREKIVEVLLEEDLNTYIVSHGWTHPLLEKVEVVKTDNVSRLEC
jgi:DNA repair exonuclease SbcCD ATPase subunit